MARPRLRPAAHIDPPLARIPALLDELGVDAFQTTLRDPQRFGKTGIPDPDDRAAFLEGLRARGRPAWGIAHASLLVNLASPDGRIRNASLSSVLGDLALAGELGLAGVCFHLGYAKGHPDRRAAHRACARKLAQLLERAEGPARPLLENGCEGTELGQTLEEIEAVLEDAGAPPPGRLGLVLDTCHLHAAGFDLADPEAPERLAEELERRGLRERLVALHLNDCEEPAGSRRDRHAVPGEGTIREGLRRLVRHPVFAGLPAVLEVPYVFVPEGVRYLAASGAGARAGRAAHA